MRLFEILGDRVAINILKLLYDVEFVFKTSHTLKYSEIKPKFDPDMKIARSINNLDKAGLIRVEKQQSLPGDLILSLSMKGKSFFDAFEGLKKVYDSEVESFNPYYQRTFRVEYNLTEQEKTALIELFHLRKSLNAEVSLKDFATRISPNQKYITHSSSLAKYLNNLENLNLIRKIKKGRLTYYDITESGEKYINDFLLEKKI